MNSAFDEVLAAGPDAMLSAFDTTALRLGTASQNIEKDFWVCWTLDALINGLSEGGPRLLIKGGTSLSKGFGLINRFSEDIDVTVFREDIGEPATIEELETLSGKKTEGAPRRHKRRLPSLYQRPIARRAGADPARPAPGRRPSRGRGAGGGRRHRCRRADLADLVSCGDATIGLCGGGDQDRVGREIGVGPEQRRLPQRRSVRRPSLTRRSAQIASRTLECSSIDRTMISSAPCPAHSRSLRMTR